MTDTDTKEQRKLLFPQEIYISPLETGLREWTNDPIPQGSSEKYIRADRVQGYDEMAAVLQDVVTLCDRGQFEPAIFLDFIRSDKSRNFMQYHMDYSQKSGSRH